jgi:hypothetical protein
MCMSCRSLYVLLYFFFWPLCSLLFVDLRSLITPLVSPSSSLTSFSLSLVIQRCCYGISFCIMISVVKLLEFTITSKKFRKSSKTNKGQERDHLLLALDIKTSFNSNQRSCWCHLLILVLYILTTFLPVAGPGSLNELGSWIT